MARRIPVSFKEDERDLRLYGHVVKQSDKSCFIKNAIEFYIDNYPLKQQIYYTENISKNLQFTDDEEDGIGEIMGC